MVRARLMTVMTEGGMKFGLAGTVVKRLLFGMQALTMNRVAAEMGRVKTKQRQAKRKRRRIKRWKNRVGQLAVRPRAGMEDGGAKPMWM